MLNLPKSIAAIPAKWRRRSRTEKMLLLEAFLLLGLARFLVLTIPFRWLARSVGKHMQESPLVANEAELRLARLIGQAVCSAAGNTPWQSVCLPQSVAGQWMLKRRGIAGTLYLGAAKSEVRAEQLAAHAWLRCGELIITGASGHRRFTVVSTFS